jgi:CBS-domain-containing membrane protein
MGCVSASQIQELSPEEWELHTVGAIAVPCSPQSTIAPDSDAMGAVARMSRAESSHLLVVEEGRLVGVIALQDLLEFLASKGKFRAAPAA